MNTTNIKEWFNITESTDLAATGGTDIEALLEQQEAEFSPDILTVPILKVGQSLTKEVENEDAEQGDFINSLTGESLGPKIGFIVCYYQQGRFAATKDGKAYVAFGNDIPDKWEPLVGPEWVGQPFSEYPEAEEKYKEAVNNKEREWGSGPTVSTTHNFTGYAIVPGLDQADEEVLVPGRVSMKRTDVPAAKKLISLKSMLRLRAFWDQTFDLTTEQRTFGRYQSYVVQVKAGRPTTDEEKLISVQLAQDVAAQRVQDNSVEDAEAKPGEPEAPAGALEV